MSPLEQSAMFQTLSGVARSQPLVRIAVKYWWLMIPAGFVMWSKWRCRTKHDIPAIMEDFAASVGPIIPLIMLSEMIASKDAAPATPPGPVEGLAGPVRDAQFKLLSQPVGSGGMAAGPYPGTVPNIGPMSPAQPVRGR